MEAQAPVKRWRSARAALVAALVLVPAAAAPDTIAFTSDRDGWRTIYTMAPDGTGVKRLFARYVGYMEFLPTWSPDGTRLAFVRGEIGYATDILRTWDRLGLCLTDPGGEKVTEIHRESGLNAPRWSPQGDRIAFHIRRDSPPVAIYNDVKWIGLGDGSVNLVTPGPRAPSNEPEWSPDGSRLMVVGGGRLYLVDPERILARHDFEATHTDSAFTPFEAPGAGARNPRWCPDGSCIAYSTRVQDRGDWDILALAVDGSWWRNLTPDSPGDDLYPSWSPDGSRLAFTSDRDGDFDIYVMSADGSQVEQLTDHPGDDYTPSWGRGDVMTPVESRTWGRIKESAR